MHGRWDIQLNLQGHKPVLALSGDGDVLDRALERATGPELDPADQRQIDQASIHLDALGIAEAIGQKLLAVLWWSSTTNEEIGIGAFQILQALLKDLRVHRMQPAVFLALLPPGKQLTCFCIGETRHACTVAMLVDRQNLIPDETTCPSEADKLCPSGTIGLQSVFVALAYLHRHIIQLVYGKYKRFSHRQTLCFRVTRPLGFCYQVSSEFCRKPRMRRYMPSLPISAKTLRRDWSKPMARMTTSIFSWNIRRK